MGARSRRGVSTVVGALAAIPAFLLLALVVLELAAQAAVEAERAQERLQVLPVVDGSVTASLVSGDRVVVRYVVVRDLETGEVLVIPGPFVVEPGRPLDVQLLPQVPDRARLDVAVVTASGNVFRWDPVTTGGDFILDIPGEPLPAGGGGLDQASKLEMLLLLQGFVEPAVCELQALLTPEEVDAVFPPVLELQAPYDAEASASYVEGVGAVALARVDGVEVGRSGETAEARASLDFQAPPPPWFADVQLARMTAYASAGPGGAHASISITIYYYFPGYTVIAVEPNGAARYLDLIAYHFAIAEAGGTVAGVSVAQGELVGLSRGDAPQSFYLLVYSCP